MTLGKELGRKLKTSGDLLQEHEKEPPRRVLSSMRKEELPWNLMTLYMVYRTAKGILRWNYVNRL